SVLERPVGGHHCAAQFVATHEDFEQKLSAPFWELFDSHVIEDQEIGLEVLCHDLVMPLERLVVHQVADRIEDAAIEDGEAGLDQSAADALGQVTFADTRRPREKNVT